jgi:hypothetical protein
MEGRKGGREGRTKLKWSEGRRERTMKEGSEGRRADLLLSQ